MFLVLDRVNNWFKLYHSEPVRHGLISYAVTTNIGNFDGLDTFIIAGEQIATDANMDVSVASFHVFDSALGHYEAMAWQKYVDNNYINYDPTWDPKFFKFLPFSNHLTITHNSWIPLVTASGASNGAYTTNKLGINKYGFNVPVTNNRFYLPPRTTWISHVNLSMRGDPDTDLRVVEIYLHSYPTTTDILNGVGVGGYGFHNHDDWTGYTEYTQYSGTILFTVPDDKPWISLIQVAKKTTANHQVRYTSMNYEDWGGITFQRIR